MSVSGIYVYVCGTCIRNRFLFTPNFQEYAKYYSRPDLGFFATLHILFIVNMQILSNSLHKPCTVSRPMGASALLHAKVWCITNHGLCKLSSYLCKVRHNARVVVCRGDETLRHMGARRREPFPRHTPRKRGVTKRSDSPVPIRRETERNPRELAQMSRYAVDSESRWLR